MDYCESPRTVHGDWYYPDGGRVLFESGNLVTFRRNRGPNKILSGRQFYGSVRLFRGYSLPPERGSFHCELPSAADPSINYVNIGEVLF